MWYCTANRLSAGFVQCIYVSLAYSSEVLNRELKMVISSVRRKDVERSFATMRISVSKSAVLLLPYFPIGIFVAILRCCLLLNFLVALQILRCFLHGDNIIVNVIVSLFMHVLGIRVKVDGRVLPVDMVVCNKRSNIDGLILCHSVSVVAENEWNLPNFLGSMLRLCSCKVQSSAGKTPPILVFPEKCATSGCGVAQFEATYFTSIKSIQVAAIEYWRPLPIRETTLYSGFFSDMFWMFFNPITIITMSMSPDCSYKDEDVSDSEFATTLTARVAKMLKKPVLQISALDKAQYLKHVAMRDTCDAPTPLLNMADRVLEIVPHVPRDVLLDDLRKTNSVDVTLANILEGIVEFTPIDIDKQSTNQTMPRISPQTAFERRKSELLELARAKYKEKHGL